MMPPRWLTVAVVSWLVLGVGLLIYMKLTIG